MQTRPGHLNKKKEITTNYIGVVNFSAADIASWTWKDYFELISFFILLWILFKWICKKPKKMKQKKDVKNIQKLADASAQIQTVPARTTTMPAVTFETQSGNRVVFMREGDQRVITWEVWKGSLRILPHTKFLINTETGLTYIRFPGFKKKTS